MDAHKHLASDMETPDPELRCADCDEPCDDEHRDRGRFYCRHCFYLNDDVVQGVEDEAQYDIWKEEA